MIDISFVRDFAELLYEGTADVYEMEIIKDPVTKATRNKISDEPKYSGVICRIDYENQPQSISRELPLAGQQVRLFISPELDIKPGSLIKVTQHNKTVDYYLSGHTEIYCSHQEIELSRKEEWI